MFTLDEFKHAAQALLSTKLKAEDMFCTMTMLENASLAVAEAYLKSEKLTNGELNEKSNIELLADTDAASHSSNNSDAATIPIQLKEVLQNFVQHVFVASQAPGKTYDKVRHIGIRHTSTKVMGETVKATERHALNTIKSQTKKKYEVIWKSREAISEIFPSETVAADEPPVRQAMP